MNDYETTKFTSFNNWVYDKALTYFSNSISCTALLFTSGRYKAHRLSRKPSSSNIFQEVHQHLIRHYQNVPRRLKLFVQREKKR